MDWPGLLALIGCYFIILIAGLTVSYKRRRLNTTASSAAVAGRDLSLVVATFSMAATFSCGGFLNGTAESVFRDGLLWTLAPFGICIGLIIGGVCFAKPMREAEYLTMLDPFEISYGTRITALIYGTTLFADLLWSGSILTALGTSLSVALGTDPHITIIVSAIFAVAYTFFGQMIAVAYTDIIQMVLIVFGLVLGISFAGTSTFLETAANISITPLVNTGSLPPVMVLPWLDLLLAMIFGSIPWQPYFQRVLSVRTAFQAQWLSFVAGISAVILAIPPVLAGKRHTGQKLSISTVCSILGTSSMFTLNVLTPLLPMTERAQLWCQRTGVIFAGAMATVLALFVKSIYDMFILAADLVYVALFPQLVAVVHFPTNLNRWFGLAGWLFAVISRLAAGIPSISLPPLTPEFDKLPHRTVSAILSFTIVVGGSRFWVWYNKRERMSAYPTALASDNKTASDDLIMCTNT